MKNILTLLSIALVALSCGSYKANSINDPTSKPYMPNVENDINSEKPILIKDLNGNWYIDDTNIMCLTFDNGNMTVYLTEYQSSTSLNIGKPTDIAPNKISINQNGVNGTFTVSDILNITYYGVDFTKVITRGNDTLNFVKNK